MADKSAVRTQYDAVAVKDESHMFLTSLRRAPWCSPSARYSDYCNSMSVFESLAIGDYLRIYEICWFGLHFPDSVINEYIFAGPKRIGRDMG